MISQLLSRVESAFASLSQGTGTLDQVLALKDEAVELLLRQPLRQKSGPEAEALAHIVELYVGSGCVDEAVDEQSLQRLVAYQNIGWCWIPVALLSAPSWQLPSLPPVEELSYAFWPAYVQALLRLPQQVQQPGQAAAVASHHLRRLNEFVRLVEANRGASVVRLMLDRYLQSTESEVLRAVPSALAELLALRARMLTLVTPALQLPEPLSFPRDDRRLKIGFVLDGAAPGASLNQAHALTRALDPLRFELFVFETSCDGAAPSPVVFPEGVERTSLSGSAQDAVQTLLDRLLDVCMFFTDGVRMKDPVSPLALSRVAPLQLALDRSNCAYPLSQLDLLLTDQAELPKARGQMRAGLLPTQGLLFVDNTKRPGSTCEWSREGLGFPEDALVLVSASPFSEITPELANAWVGLLSSLPHTRLILYSQDRADSTPDALHRICSLLNTRLEAAGVDLSRIIISNDPFPSVAEQLALLSLADLYVDAVAVGDREGARLALEMGIPVVSIPAGPGLLSTLPSQLERMGLAELSPADLSTAVATLTTLCTEPARLAKLRERLMLSLASDEQVMDPLALGEAWGTLLTQAFDELIQVGAPAFRSNRDPVRVRLDEASDTLLSECEILFDAGIIDDVGSRLSRLLAVNPCHGGVITLYRRVLLEQGRWDRAQLSLLSALRRQAARPELWYQLCKAYRGDGKRDEALKAIETTLRLAPRDLEAWLTLSELAKESGNDDFLRELVGLVTAIDDKDERVLALKARYGMPAAPEDKPRADAS